MAKDEDPPEYEREWVRHATTGDRGYMVVRNGERMVKYDRPGQEMLRKYNEQQWLPDREKRPFARFHVGRVQYEADAQLCFFLGKYDRYRLKWESLTDGQRKGWIEKGPPKSQEARAMLWTAIKMALEPYTDQS